MRKNTLTTKFYSDVKSRAIGAHFVLKLAMICFCIGILLFLIPISVNAEEVEQRVFDEAGLFTESEAAQLETSIDALREKMNMDVAVVTTNDAEGKTSRNFADDFYEEKGLGVGNGESGVLFLIDMDNREIYISTAGKMITYLTDARIDSILDMAFEGVSTGNYYNSATSFLRGVEQYFDAGIVRGQYQFDEETGEITRYRSLEIYEIIIAVVISVGVGAAFYGIVMYKYRGRSGSYKFPLRQNSGVQLTNQQDIFINQTITKMRIQQNKGSGGSGGSGVGRSTTHRSSSGRNHGGGGRRF